MNVSTKTGLTIITILIFSIGIFSIFSDDEDAIQKNIATKQNENIQNIQETSLEVIKNTEQKTNEKTTELQVEKIEQNKPTLFKVVKVVDGDTLDIDIDGKIERIRLIGMDTPETVDPRKVVQCFGKEASDKAKEILSEKMVSVEADNSQGERDGYGRLLRYVYLEDGSLFNKYMIAEGYAHEYTYQSNPYKYQIDFQEAEKQSRETKKGLWNPDTCNGDTNQAATLESTNSTAISNTNSVSTNDSQDLVVKKSRTGICHAPGTTYYNKTQNYTPYNSLDECLKSGGRLPKR